MITAVHPGLVQKWNEGHPDHLIRPNHRLVEVNGDRGAAQRLAARLKEHGGLRLVLQQPVEVQLALAGGGAKLLGVDLSFTSFGTTLLITRINPGLIQDWNELHK